jgi:hypothetical protein
MKHILNNLTEQEKQSILEQHKGGMKVVNENFSKLIKATLGDAKPLVSEQADDQNTHRYDKGEQSPGIEKFLGNPSDEKISTGLLNQLRNDPFGKGKIVIIFNGEKFKEPGSFLFKIQSDSKAGKCYEITNYDYNNRFILNTQIKITANGVECKKTTEPIKTGGDITPIKTSGGTDNDQTKPKPKPKKFCKAKLLKPNSFADVSPNQIKQIQQFCSRNKNLWFKRYTDGTTGVCTSKDIDGKIGCCTLTCMEILERKKVGPPPSSFPTVNN